MGNFGCCTHFEADVVLGCLAKVREFQTLRDEDQAFFAGLLESREYSKSEKLWRYGEKSDRL